MITFSIFTSYHADEMTDRLEMELLRDFDGLGIGWKQIPVPVAAVCREAACQQALRGSCRCGNAGSQLRGLGTRSAHGETVRFNKGRFAEGMQDSNAVCAKRLAVELQMSR